MLTRDERSPERDRVDTIHPGMSVQLEAILTADHVVSAYSFVLSQHLDTLKKTTRNLQIIIHIYTISRTATYRRQRCNIIIRRIAAEPIDVRHHHIGSQHLAPRLTAAQTKRHILVLLHLAGQLDGDLWPKHLP